MLSRTADHLFWMSRYTERAENTARMLDVNYQTSLLPQSDRRGADRLAGPAVSISELLPAYTAKLRRASTPSDVMDFMVQGREKSVEHRLLPARCPRKRARRARHADHRGLGNPEPDLAGSQPHAAQRRLRARPGPVFRMGQVPLAPVARRDAGHHAAGRGLPLPAPGHLPGARRQHRAAGRREVPCRPERLLRHAPARRTRSTTSTTGAPSCAASRPSRSTARCTAT